MQPNPKEIEAIIFSPGEVRYTYFVKKIVDWEQVWGIYNDGWALASTDEEQSVFLVWPAEKYAKLCIKSMWLGFEPKMIPLNDFLGELLPRLNAHGVALGVFPTPENSAVVVDIDRIMEDIHFELSKY